jgi:hypothetical protein
MRPILCSTLLAFATCVIAPNVGAQTLLENSTETRMQLDLQVPDAALKPFLPEGFSSNVAAQGAAKDCNLRLVFIDRITVNAPDGKPLGKGSNRLVYLVAPVKDAAGANAQLVIGGITEDPADAPGPFANYLPAATHEMKRTTTDGASGPILDTQDWLFTAATGEHLEMHIQYERGSGNLGKASDQKFYSSKTPATPQISHQTQVLDILRNTSTNPPDRVKTFTLKVSGGSYAKLFDPAPKVLSWDNILWIERSVSTP